MHQPLPFATSSHQPDRRLHARLLAGVLLGVAAFSPGAVTAAGPPADSALWASAAQIARASRWFFPGRAVIEETARLDRSTTRSRVTARLEHRTGAEPAVAVTEVRVDNRDLTRDKADAVATTLGPLVDALYRPDHPLVSHNATDTQPAGEAVIDGARCRGFVTCSRMDGVAITMTTWIDTTRGFARRIEYRALNLPFERDGTFVREFTGTSEYTLDAANRWLLVRQSAHSKLKAPASVRAVEVRSDRTITCADHWEYHGPRRTDAPPASGP